MRRPEVGDNNFCGCGFPLHFRERTFFVCLIHIVYLETGLAMSIIDLEQTEQTIICSSTEHVQASKTPGSI